MSHLRKSRVDHTPRDRTALSVGDEDEVLETLSSDTAQAIMDTLGDGPRPLSEIAETVGTSLQNTQYHVEQLVEAGLVEQADVWYSPKGREMAVYALTAQRLVVRFDGD